MPMNIHRRLVLGLEYTEVKMANLGFFLVSERLVKPALTLGYVLITQIRPSNCFTTLI